MPEKKTTSRDDVLEAETTSTDDDVADEDSEVDLGPQFVIAQEGDPDAPTAAGKLWTASLNDSGHTIELTGKTREQVEERAREILASREAAAAAAQQDRSWIPASEGRDKDVVTEER